MENQDCLVNDRSSAHGAAWHSPKRKPQKVGRHFKLEDSRIWMRLHFAAMREVGIVEKNPSFAEYYVRFIGHFVRIYEGRASMFAREAFRWSSDQERVRAYEENGRLMSDVIGKSFNQHLTSIPVEETDDVVWPYHDTHEEMEEAGGDIGW